MIVYYPEGSAPYTDNVDAADVASHVAAGGCRANEARALDEFRRAGEVPSSLLDESYALHRKGATDSGTPFASYVRVTDFRGAVVQNMTQTDFQRQSEHIAMSTQQYSISDGTYTTHEVTAATPEAAIAEYASDYGFNTPGTVGCDVRDSEGDLVRRFKIRSVDGRTGRVTGIYDAEGWRVPEAQE